jgi:hypothetical protein
MNKPAGSRRVVLHNLRDDRGLRHLGAERQDDGSIVIEGHDLGPGVEVLGPGLTEYEWVWTVASEHVPAAIEALGGEAGDDPLRLLKVWCAEHKGADPGIHLKSAGVSIAFWNRIGD